MVADLCRPGGGDLALVMKGSLAADRREHDRACILLPEDLGRHVDLADVDQPARPELEFQEAFAISAQRDLVVDAGGHVAEMRGRNVIAADRLEIEDVDRLLGRLDEVVGAHGRPHQRIGKLGPGRKPFAGEGFKPSGGKQRTSGQELKELAPAGGVIGERRHGEPSLKSDGRAIPTLSAGMCAAPGPSYTAPKSRDNRPDPLRRSQRGSPCPRPPKSAQRSASSTRKDASSSPTPGTWARRAICKVSDSRRSPRPARASPSRRASPTAACLAR